MRDELIAELERQEPFRLGIRACCETRVLTVIALDGPLLRQTFGSKKAFGAVPPTRF